MLQLHLHKQNIALFIFSPLNYEVTFNLLQVYNVVHQKEEKTMLLKYTGVSSTVFVDEQIFDMNTNK